MSHSSSTSWKTCWLVGALGPAHTASDSRSLSADPAQRSPLAAGWRACQCGARWWSKRTRRRQPHSTSAPTCCGTWRPCQAARGTPSPPTAAAALKLARWSSPRRRGRRTRWYWHPSDTKQSHHCSLQSTEAQRDECRSTQSLLLTVYKVLFWNNLLLFCEPILSVKKSKDWAENIELMLLLWILWDAASFNPK